MLSPKILEKLEILSDAAKYDVSCSSSGIKKSNSDINKVKGLGNSSGVGICHAYSEDGRCISLLKILFTNYCIFDCAYCVSRKSNDNKKISFTVDEVVELTLSFYRRNYIEGLFLSSGIFKNPDYTMERLMLVCKKLREQNFNGYIHLKAIPGASQELIHQAGMYADRMSVNVEMPTEKSLKLLAPEKSMSSVLTPMKSIKAELISNKEERKLFKSAPKFAPAGQSTQMIIGATDENDMQILAMSNYFYSKMNLKRVYYSGYVPVLEDSRLPALTTQVPLLREHRLYQADWLLRFYNFDVNEIVNNDFQHLDLDIDPKLSWALRNPQFFPLDINTADYLQILRIPGVGVKSAKKIINSRRYAKLNWEHLKKFGIAFNRAKYFISCDSRTNFYSVLDKLNFRDIILNTSSSKYQPLLSNQLNLFG